MRKRIRELFELSGKYKITFNPAIKVQESYPIWIDDLSKVNDMLFVTISTVKDGCRKNVDDLTEAQLSSLKYRMELLYGEKIK